MKTARVSSFALALTLASTLGCINAADHSRELHSTNEREMTVGIVQKEIRQGMSQADVAEALGSPNIVTRDSEGRESWIYDKIATEASYSNSSGRTGAVGVGGRQPGVSLLLGIITGSYEKNAGAYAQTQKTLTVVIKYDGRGRVDTFSYHSSKF